MKDTSEIWSPPKTYIRLSTAATEGEARGSNIEGIISHRPGQEGNWISIFKNIHERILSRSLSIEMRNFQRKKEW